MANGPRYRVPFRRRREGKTNYHRRFKLILSNKYRLVIRCSKRHTIVQIVESYITGDKVLVQAHSQQLEKLYKWKYNTGNQPSAYLTGYLCGMRAKKAGIEEAILDVGILVHDNRVKSAFKGVLDSGLQVNHDDKWFPESLEERVKGTHIQQYAEKLSKEDPKKYKAHFSEVLKKKADPKKIVSEFDKVKAQIAKLV